MREMFQVMATVTRKRKGYRSSVQIPLFFLPGMSSLQAAASVAGRILDPHSNAESHFTVYREDTGGYAAFVRKNGRLRQTNPRPKKAK